MLKKLGFGATISGIILMMFGSWTLDADITYNSDMKTIMEFAPWLFMILGAFSLLAGIFYLLQAIKPTSRKRARILEKNGNQVIAEFEDGSRKTLTTGGKITLVVGDVGTIGCKGNFIVEFSK